MSNLVRVTVAVPSDQTDFKNMTESLKSIGMEVKHIVEELGVIKGEVHPDNVKHIKGLAGVSFVFSPESMEGISWTK